MGLEAASFLNDLNTANPDGADTKAEGDNHIRLLKTVLKATFPGLAGAAWRSQTKSSGYTPIATDNMSLLNCTAALTLSMTAAATLGNGYLNVVHANGGDVTIDPNGAELVNGAATFVIPNGFMGVLLCNGSAFVCGIFPVAQASLWSTGDVKATYKVVADLGWVMLNDGTIGDATSGGTTRANADTVALFTHLWNNTADAQCAVSTGRGANAAADFAAHKTIALPKMLGRALASAGAGAGLTSRALALITGVETHQLTQAETPVKSHAHTASDSGHSHSNSVPIGTGTGGATSAEGQFDGNPITVGATFSGTRNWTNASVGSGNASITVNATGDATANAHPNMQPSTFLNFMIKL